jgi:hypothetical protein
LWVHIRMSLIKDDTTKWKKSKTELLLPVRAKSFIKSVDKLFKQLHQLLKKSRSRRISLPNPQSIKIRLRFYMILFILLICIETNLDEKNHLLCSCRDIAPTSLNTLVLQHWIAWTFDWEHFSILKSGRVRAPKKFNQIRSFNWNLAGRSRAVISSRCGPKRE